MIAVLTLTLAVMILISVTAHAWDAHGIDPSGHHLELVSPGPADSGHDSQPHSCGHCRHMSFHLLAFVSGESTGTPHNPAAGAIHFPDSWPPAP